MNVPVGSTLITTTLGKMEFGGAFFILGGGSDGFYSNRKETYPYDSLYLR